MLLALSNHALGYRLTFKKKHCCHDNRASKKAHPPERAQVASLSWWKSLRFGFWAFFTVKVTACSKTANTYTQALPGEWFLSQVSRIPLHIWHQPLIGSCTPPGLCPVHTGKHKALVNILCPPIHQELKHFPFPPMPVCSLLHSFVAARGMCTSCP